MKLFFSPGACSLAPQIVAREAGLPVEFILAPTKTKTLPDGSSYLAVNPKGYVPALVMDDGALLTEGPVISQYLADLAPASGLAPAAGTMARYRVMEWLTFIGTEVHKAFSPLFTPGMPDEAKAIFVARIGQRLKWVDEQLQGRPFLTGDTFTVADAYLFTVTQWCAPCGVDLSERANLRAWRERIAARPAVQAALAHEAAARESMK